MVDALVALVDAVELAEDWVVADAVVVDGCVVVVVVVVDWLSAVVPPIVNF